MRRSCVSQSISSLTIVVESIETFLLKSKFNLNVNLALKQEYECRQLPPIELCRFRGHPSEWPEFIPSFRRIIHDKVSFDDNMRMEGLLSVLDGEAKRFVESIGCDGIFYATALKSVKRDFGNPALVSHLKIKSVFNQHQLKPNDKIGLRTYHQQIKIANPWLLSMGYQNPILFCENLYKAVTLLPNYLRTQFYKATRDCDLTDGTTNLLSFGSWLEKRIKDLFNPSAEIIAIQEASSKHQQHPKHSFKRKILSNFITTMLTRKIKTKKRVQTNKNYKETKGAVSRAGFARKNID